MADLRRCIGSAKFGIEAHDASPEDFPVQPSQKDGLGRMCKVHWRAYTNALRNAALARKAGDGPRVPKTSAGTKPKRAKTDIKPVLKPAKKPAKRPVKTSPAAETARAHEEATIA
jgi:hypothetical protein